MTYEEAKIQIQAIPEKIWDQLSEPDREAMEMAFSALQVQEAKHSTESSSTHKALDTISRQEAIDALVKAIRKDPYYDRNEAINGLGVCDVRVILNDLPSAQPEPQWIPVSERLPEELEAVIITWKNHEPEPYYSDIKHKPFIGVGIYHREKWWWWSAYAEDMLAEYGDSKADRMDEAIEVTAWMPLPEPYRAERRTDDANDIT